jgi:hypothetical protein
MKAYTHWIGGWVGPRAVLDAVVKRKIPIPRRESNPRTRDHSENIGVDGRIISEWVSGK